MLRTITVAELIDRLQAEDPDAKLLFTADYGDYCHTPQALPIRGEFEEGVAVEESAYSKSGYALVDDERAMELAREDNSDTYLIIR